jgi:hypothetical protein
VSLGRNHARPRCTVALVPRPWCQLSPRVCTARGHAGAQPTATRVRPALARPASASAAHDHAAHAGAVTAPARTSRRGRRWCHSSGDGTNGGGRAPTTVRLPAGHRGRHASLPELLVDGEEKKSSSTAASPRRGGATVAGGDPATVRRERRVSSSSTGEEWRGEALGQRSPDGAHDGEGGDNGEGSARTAGRGTFGQRHADTACRGGGAREAEVGRSGRAARRRRGSAVGTRGRAVPTAALSRCADAARGGHTAVVRCRVGPVRHATADKRGPLVSVF